MADAGQLSPRFATALRDGDLDMPPEMKAQIEKIITEAYTSNVQAGDQLVKDKTD